jgi:hypothetical protein
MGLQKHPLNCGFQYQLYGREHINLIYGWIFLSYGRMGKHWHWDVLAMIRFILLTNLLGLALIWYTVKVLRVAWDILKLLWRA